jgi:hypothetical protein
MQTPVIKTLAIHTGRERLAQSRLEWFDTGNLHTHVAKNGRAKLARQEVGEVEDFDF